MKIKTLFAGMCAAALLLSACQQNPEDSLVVHKNMENLISEAQTESAGKADAEAIREEVSKVERYQTEIENEGLHVNVTVDAEVEVPQNGTLSVYRVRQKKLDASFVERVRQALVGDEQLYDASVLSTETKQDIEDRIAAGRKALQEYEAEIRSAVDENGDPAFTEEQIEEDLEQMQWEYVGMWEEAYETAPDTLDYGGFAIDGELRSVGELYAENAERYAYYDQLIPAGDLVQGVTDGSTGTYKAFKAMNSENYSSWLQYTARPDRVQYDFNGVMAPQTDLRTAGQSAFGRPLNPNQPENFLADGYDVGPETEFVRLAGEDTTLSEEDAVAQAEAFLETVGLTDFRYGEGGLYNELAGWETQGESAAVVYRNYYILHFFRDVDGVPLTQSSGTKMSVEDAGKQVWPGEVVEFKINDSGIVAFGYYAPVEITETVVEGAAMKPFSEIRDTFESMVCVVNAAEDLSTAVTVDRVCLSYSRISEQDAFDTGLIVPVWSFEGQVKMTVEGTLIREWKGTVLAINAIDGSVIDSALGY